MRNRIAIALALILMLSIAGCKATLATESTNAAASADLSATPGARRGNDIMTLALGTLALDGTANAVDTAQAAQLLPLWKGYLALLASDATAPAELTALVAQIRQTLTAEQTTALETQIDPEAQSALMARYGLEMPAMGMARELPEGMTEEDVEAMMAERQAAREAGGGAQGPTFRVEGGFGAGGPPGGGAGPMGSGGIEMEGDGFEGPGVPGATGGATIGANTWVTSIVDAVITYLEGIQ
jgi:hypothetical protein